MAHIQLQEGLPGIVGPLAFSPDTAHPLCQLAEVLLRGPNTLTSAEREMIAAHVSYRTNVTFASSPTALRRRRIWAGTTI